MRFLQNWIQTWPVHCDRPGTRAVTSQTKNQYHGSLPQLWRKNTEKKHGSFFSGLPPSLQSPGIIAGIIKAHPTSPRHQNSSHTLDKFSQEIIHSNIWNKLATKKQHLDQCNRRGYTTQCNAIVFILFELTQGWQPSINGTNTRKFSTHRWSKSFWRGAVVELQYLMR